MIDSVVSSETPGDSGGVPPAGGDDLYRLLGLIPFESNPNVISSRVRELMREQRKYQLGAYAAKARLQLEELADATACLLDPSRKQTYDDNLRRLYGLPPISVTSTYVAPVEAEPRPAPSDDNRRRGGLQLLKLVLAGIAAFVAIVIAFRLFVPHAEGPQPPIRKPFAADNPTDGASSSKNGTADLRASSVPASGQHTKRTKTAIATPSHQAEPVKAWNGGPVNDIGNPLAATRADQRDRGTRDRHATPRRDESTTPATAANKPSADGVASPAVVASSSPQSAERPPHSAASRTRHAVAKPPVEPDIHLASADILRELRELRLKRSPAQRVSSNPSSIGMERVVELVRYGRSAFSDERSFQRQLDQEVAALKRVYPQLRDILSDPAR